MSDFEYDERPLRVHEYRAPGPVARQFLNTRERIRFIMGPQGSGKTTGCLFDAIACASAMPPGKDGHKHFAGVVIRDTYTNLWATTIRSWNKFFPQTVGTWSGGVNRPAVHKLRFDDPILTRATGRTCYIFVEMHFKALADQSVEDALRGAEYTWAYMNEADRLSEDVLTFLIGRIGRYPGQDMFDKPTDFFRGIVGDVNPPDTDSWIYHRFEEALPKLHRFFKQPGGRTPRAENLPGLPRGYYEDQVAANASKPWWIKRMVDGQFGYSREGMPVYELYDDDKHCSETELEPIPSLPLRLSFDQGITGPAMLVSQYATVGQLRTLREFVPGRMGAQQFGEQCRQFVNAHFPGYQVHPASAVDPAGMSGAVREDAHFSWAETVAQASGFNLVPAETNELDIRIDGVSQMLSTDIKSGMPSFILDPRCLMLRRGFNSDYRFKKKQNGEFEDKPEKNAASNPHDALQYEVMSIFGRAGIIQGQPRKNGVQSVRSAVLGHDAGPQNRGLPIGHPLAGAQHTGPMLQANFDVFKL
ncbi:hypothetical protein [Mesorhizobium sp.]|uniref:hypothetical protein n=1 Tax=Mesorhizobium sp. TaxID=1871066 RepID=UPI0011F67C34|nr:hypothetical protein [Mesorhizobium sp.]TIL36215.1 MAG: hypothetical protein E5Y85_00885 [Mesorhizobium sp.]